MLKKLLLCLLILIPSAVFGQYPERLTRIVSPFSAGGGLDVVARLIAPKLSEIYKQLVIVENRTGANGQIANEFVAKSAPDGYTLLLTTAAIAIAPSIYKRLSFDPIRDFVAITKIGYSPAVMLVHQSVRANSIVIMLSLAALWLLLFQLHGQIIHNLGDVKRCLGTRNLARIV